MKKMFLLSLLCSLFTFTASAQLKPNMQKINYQVKGAPIPPFVLDKTMGGTFTNTQLTKGKGVMLVIFSPQCDHCEHMMDSLKNMEANFASTQLLLVAEDRNKDFMKDFIRKTAIGDHPLFRNIGTERGRLIPYIYNQKLLPQVNFYDKNYKLVQSFSGHSPMDSIRMFIK